MSVYFQRSDISIPYYVQVITAWICFLVHAWHMQFQSTQSGSKGWKSQISIDPLILISQLHKRITSLPPQVVVFSDDFGTWMFSPRRAWGNVSFSCQSFALFYICSCAVYFCMDMNKLCIVLWLVLNAFYEELAVLKSLNECFCVLSEDLIEAWKIFHANLLRECKQSHKASKGIHIINAGLGPVLSSQVLVNAQYNAGKVSIQRSKLGFAEWNRIRRSPNCDVERLILA